MKVLDLILSDEQCEQLTKLGLSLGQPINTDDEAELLCQGIFDRALSEI
jgi:hypothetical protein